jgi:hypothetical protein
MVWLREKPLTLCLSRLNPAGCRSFVALAKV